MSSNFQSIRITERATQELPASDPKHLVRLGEVEAMASELAAFLHTHRLSQIEDLASGLPPILLAALGESSSIRFRLSSGVIYAEVKLSEGLTVDETGVACDFGSGVGDVARGNHTHSGMHDPVTAEATNTVAIFVGGQELTADVILDPLGGLTATSSGVGCDFGSGVNQVARGDHAHEGEHSRVTAIVTSSLALYANADQLMSGVVRTTEDAGAGRTPVKVGQDHLYVELGSGVGQAAAGNHTHAAATPDTDGFLSAADKLKLDVLSSGVSLIEHFAAFVHDAPCYRNDYVGGRYRFRIRSHLTECNITGVCGSTPYLFTMEVDGQLTSKTILLSGVEGVEVHNMEQFEHDLPLISGLYTGYVRFLCTSGVGVGEVTPAERISINVGVRPY